MPLNHRESTYVHRSHAIPLALTLAIAVIAPAAAGEPPHRDVLRIDGIVVELERRNISHAALDALDAQAAAWERESPSDPVVRSTVGPWRVLGQRRGSVFRSAQFMGTPSGTVVTLSTRDVHAKPRPPVPPFPLPAGVEVVRTVETVDEQPSVLQVVARARCSASALRERLRTAAERDGWRSQRLTAASPDAPTSLLAWTRGPDELLVTLAGDERDARALLHVVRRASRDAR